MKHFATPRFWEAYAELPASVRRVADANYKLLRAHPYHPSLHLKKVGRFWSVRVGLRYRALGVQQDEAIIWFWIGGHSEYDRLIS